MAAKSLDQIVSLCKRRGFIFPGSEIYGGLQGTFDYGPLGVELKNNLAIQGTLHSVDQYLNIKLHNTRVVNEQKYPHMVRGMSAAA